MWKRGSFYGLSETPVERLQMKPLIGGVLGELMDKLPYYNTSFGGVY